jgi:CheY-like chemotaxis protein
MPFQALLVSKDEDAAAILTPLLGRFGVTLKACGYPESVCLLAEEKYDAVIVDFDDPQNASMVLQNAAQGPGGHKVVTIAILGDKTRVRTAFGQGANFVLYKPLSVEQAEASLRAATALIKRERRGSYRVPVQIPALVRPAGGSETEGILLDLSEDGMDLLTPQAFSRETALRARFVLPGKSKEAEYTGEVAWTNANGQCGVRFFDLPAQIRSELRQWVQSHASDLPPEPEAVAESKLTDLSLGGCYVETESPFPEGSGIILSLNAENMEVRAEGMVRVMHPNFGMGIEFAARTDEQRQTVARFIEFLTSRPGTIPQLSITPSSLIAVGAFDGPTLGNQEVEDSLLELLRDHQSLTQEEFLEELRRQRSTEEVTT